MIKFLLSLVAAAVCAYLLGMFFAAVTSGSPGHWLTVQRPTGHSPQLVGLLAFGPIVLVGLVVVVIRLYQRWKMTYTQNRIERR